MDSLSPALIDWALRIGMVAIGGYAAWPAISWVLGKVRGLKTTTTGEADDRPALNAALCLLADRASQTKCDKLRPKYDAAITELATMVVRDEEYVPPA